MTLTPNQFFNCAPVTQSISSAPVGTVARRHNWVAEDVTAVLVLAASHGLHAERFPAIENGVSVFFPTGVC